MEFKVSSEFVSKEFSGISGLWETVAVAFYHRQKVYFKIHNVLLLVASDIRNV